MVFESKKASVSLMIGRYEAASLESGNNGRLVELWISVENQHA